MFRTLLHFRSFFFYLTVHTLHIISSITSSILIHQLLQLHNILLIKLNFLLHITQITWNTFNLTFTTPFMNLSFLAISLNLLFHVNHLSLVHLWHFSVLILNHCGRLVLNTILIGKLLLDLLSITDVRLLCFVLYARWLLLNIYYFSSHLNITSLQSF